MSNFKFNTSFALLSSWRGNLPAGRQDDLDRIFLKKQILSPGKAGLQNDQHKKPQTANLVYKKGFTIIELLIAVSVMIIATAISYTVWGKNIQRDSRDVRRIADVNNIKLYVEAFYEKNNVYPPLGLPGERILVSTSSQPWIPEVVPEFAKFLPEDPFPAPAPAGFYYLYWVSADHRSYNVWARLENENDPRIYNKPQAQCQANPPPPPHDVMNYCGAGF